MTLKINILPIIRDHINTLYDFRTKKKFWDIFLFLLIPVVIAVIFFIITPVISDGLLSIIATVFTIFTALLLSLLLLMYNISDKLRNNPKSNAYLLLKETTANISFLILTSIVSLFVIIFLSIISENRYIVCELPCLLNVVSFVSYFMIGIFGYTILIVLKRVYTLLNEVLEPDENVSE